MNSRLAARILALVCLCSGLMSGQGTVINGARTTVGAVDNALSSNARPMPVGLGAPLSSLCNEAKPISAVTAASPPVVTSASHGFSNGSIAVVYGAVVGGMTGLTGTFMVGNATTNTFNLCGYWDGSNCVNPPTTAGTYTSGAFASRHVGREYFRLDATAGANKYYCTDSGGSPTWTQQSSLHAINFSIDNGSAVIATGDIKVYKVVRYACTIVSAMITGSPAGSITVDVWKHNDAIPTSSDKISASSPVSFSSTQINSNSSLSGWTLAVSDKDVFGFNVASVTSVTHADGVIWCQ